MADWNIQTRSPRCHGCDIAFTEGMKGASLLLPDEHNQMQRKDFCAVCFEAHAETLRKERLSAWKFTIPKAAPVVKKEEPIHRDSATELLKKLIDRGHHEDAGLICLLAILLERSKLFIERTVTLTPEGKRERVYEERASGAFYTIVDPGLKEEDIEPLQHRIVQLLDHGLDPVDQTATTIEGEGACLSE